MTKEQIFALVQFNEKLGKPPLETELKELNGQKYLPIDRVETKLFEFFHIWQTRNFTTTVIANEMVGSIELGVFHPVLCEWIWVVGAAADMIGQKSGSDVTDISAKIKNTLKKDYPHLLTDCIKNAALKLGKAFGAGLNRQEKDNFSVADALKTANFNKSELLELVKNELQFIDNSIDVRPYFMSLPSELRIDQDFVKLCGARSEFLKTKQLGNG
jgi:hypothetical protein